MERQETCSCHNADGATEPNVSEALSSFPECTGECIGKDGWCQVESTIPTNPHLRSFNNIRFLDLSDAGLDDQHLRSLCQTRREDYQRQTPARNYISMTQHLERLDLSRNRITGQGVCELSRHLRASCPSLWWLDLSENEIGDDGIEALAANLLLQRDDGTKAEDTCSLWGLVLRHTNIGDRSAKAIAQALKTHEQHEVSTRSNRALPAKQQQSSLENLDLSYNSIGPIGASALAQSVQCSSVRELLVYGNPIQDAGARAFHEMLLSDRPPPPLRRLGLDVASVSLELRSRIMRDLQFPPQVACTNHLECDETQTETDQEVSLDSVSLNSIEEPQDRTKLDNERDGTQEAACGIILSFLADIFLMKGTKKSQLFELCPDGELKGS